MTRDEAEDLLRQLADERAELQAVVADARRVVADMRAAVRSANEAAGWIAGEVSRMRR